MIDFFNEILNLDRWMRLAHLRVKKSDFFDQHVCDFIKKFLHLYTAYNNLTPREVVKIYSAFTSMYSKHIRLFLNTGKYPKELNLSEEVERVEYDIVLILSILLSTHRHKIFVNLKNVVNDIKGDVAIVGVGPGLELELFESMGIRITAYDTSISDFVKHQYCKHKLNESYFEGGEKNYDVMFAVELLEHLYNPIEFVDLCRNSLKMGGRLICTTATNVPQFDHLYNFLNTENFEKTLKRCGWEVANSEWIFHDSFDLKLEARNNWYDLVKL